MLVTILILLNILAWIILFRSYLLVDYRYDTRQRIIERFDQQLKSAKSDEDLTSFIDNLHYYKIPYNTSFIKMSLLFWRSFDSFYTKEELEIMKGNF